MSPSGDQFSDNVGSVTTPPACISSCTSRGATYAGIVSWNVSVDRRYVIYYILTKAPAVIFPPVTNDVIGDV